MSKFTQLRHPEDPTEDPAGWIRILVTRYNTAEPALSDRYTSSQETELTSLHIDAIITESKTTQRDLLEFFKDVKKYDRKTYDYPLDVTDHANHEVVKTPFFAALALETQLWTTVKILRLHRGGWQPNKRTAETRQRVNRAIDAHLQELERTLQIAREGLKEARKVKE